MEHERDEEKAILNQKVRDSEDLIGSFKSLNTYESNSWKCLFPQILAATLATSFHIGNGMCTAFAAITISQLGQPDSDIKPTNAENSWIASIMIGVVPVASIFCGILVDRAGRLNTIKIASIPGVIGWCVIASAKNVPSLIFGRILVGIASVWGTSPAMVYVTEVVNSNLRLSLLELAQAFGAMGMIMTFSSGWYLHWRTVAWLSNIFVIIPSAVCFLIHESPSWLIWRGKFKEAQKSLDWFHQYQPQPKDKKETFAELKFKLLRKEQEGKREDGQSEATGWKTTINEFLKPTGYKPIIILIVFFFCQQFCGIFVFMFYSITFFQEAGTNIDAYFASIMMGVLRLVMSLLNIYFFQAFGRRPLLFTSSIGMAVSMFISGLYTMWIKEGVTDQKWVPMAALLFFFFASSIGFMSLPTMMVAELFPIEIRGIGQSTGYSICCIFMFLSLRTYYSLSDFLGGATNLQWFYSIMALAGLVYAYIFVPETRGKQLNEISNYFKKGWTFIGRDN